MIEEVDHSEKKCQIQKSKNKTGNLGHYKKTKPVNNMHIRKDLYQRQRKLFLTKSKKITSIT